MKNTNEPSQTTTHLARAVLASFLFTFMLVRVLVFMIMARTIPDLYLHLHGTHIHHLNYGIFLLSGVGAYLLFWRPVGRNLNIAAGLYGIALALTFDEFGMWIHLGGSYWQRASWDAIVVISAIFAIIAFAPAIKHFRPHHWLTVVLLLLVLTVFTLLFIQSFKYTEKKLEPKIQKIETSNPH